MTEEQNLLTLAIAKYANYLGIDTSLFIEVFGFFTTPAEKEVLENQDILLINREDLKNRIKKRKAYKFIRFDIECFVVFEDNEPLFNLW